MAPTAAAFADRARAVVALESALAEAQAPRVALRDPIATYNPTDLPALEALAPNFDWAAFRGGRGAGEDWAAAGPLLVAWPSYLAGMDAALAAASAEAVGDYLRWHAVRLALPHLSEVFVAEANAFQVSQLRRSLLVLYWESQVRCTREGAVPAYWPACGEQCHSTGRSAPGQAHVFGLVTPPPRWERCVSLTNSALGFALSKLYVEVAFSGESKPAAEEMIGANVGEYPIVIPDRASEKIKLPCSSPIVSIFF